MKVSINTDEIQSQLTAISEKLSASGSFFEQSSKVHDTGISSNISGQQQFSKNDIEKIVRHAITETVVDELRKEIKIALAQYGKSDKGVRKHRKQTQALLMRRLVKRIQNMPGKYYHLQ